MNQECIHERVRVSHVDWKHAFVKQGVIDVVASVPQRPNCIRIVEVETRQDFFKYSVGCFDELCALCSVQRQTRNRKFTQCKLLRFELAGSISPPMPHG